MNKMYAYKYIKIRLEKYLDDIVLGQESEITIEFKPFLLDLTSNCQRHLLCFIGYRKLIMK